ncbi:MAG: hypothetical protein LUE92_05590 [Clostridiales bacterium]|nr:hypothetical protein [Clostridiales bacterium]
MNKIGLALGDNTDALSIVCGMKKVLKNKYEIVFFKPDSLYLSYDDEDVDSDSIDMMSELEQRGLREYKLKLRKYE